MTKLQKIILLAQAVADGRPDFFLRKGAGEGDRDTNSFMAELRKKAREEFGADLSEQKISGENSLRVDFYFPEEGAIVEIALSLRNPQSEFERDILKAVMAKKAGSKVDTLMLISKPGAIKRQSQPSSKAIIKWVDEEYKIKVVVREMRNTHGPRT